MLSVEYIVMLRGKYSPQVRYKGTHDKRNEREGEKKSTNNNNHHNGWKHS